jgi:simple sugar transport system ATP-binding protein
VALEAASRREFAPRGLLRWGRILGYAQGLMRDFNVVGASPTTTMEHLSGGNQQKVIMGMAISPLPQLLIVSQPTRGLDVAATEYVRRKLIECRTNGMAILLFSTDLDEVLSVSDRVGVMYRGRLQGVIASEEADRENVGAMMAGLLGDRGTQTGGAAQ